LDTDAEFAGELLFVELVTEAKESPRCFDLEASSDFWMLWVRM